MSTTKETPLEKHCHAFQDCLVQNHLVASCWTALPAADHT